MPNLNGGLYTLWFSHFSMHAIIFQNGLPLVRPMAYSSLVYYCAQLFKSTLQLACIYSQTRVCRSKVVRGRSFTVGSLLRVPNCDGKQWVRYT